MFTKVTQLPFLKLNTNVMKAKTSALLSLATVCILSADILTNEKDVHKGVVFLIAFCNGILFACTAAVYIADRAEKIERKRVQGIVDQYMASEKKQEKTFGSN